LDERLIHDGQHLLALLGAEKRVPSLPREYAYDFAIMLLSILSVALPEE